MLSAMINAWSVEDLACILEVARRGNPRDGASGQRCSGSMEGHSAGRCRLFPELAGARVELEGFFDAIESVLSDVESFQTMRFRIRQRRAGVTVARATQLVHDIAGNTVSIRVCPERVRPIVCEEVLSGRALPDERSWVELLASARESRPWTAMENQQIPVQRSLPERFAGLSCWRTPRKADIDAVGRRRVPHRSDLPFGGSVQE